MCSFYDGHFRNRLGPDPIDRFASPRPRDEPDVRAPVIIVQCPSEVVPKAPASFGEDLLQQIFGIVRIAAGVAIGGLLAIFMAVKTFGLLAM